MDRSSSISHNGVLQRRHQGFEALILRLQGAMLRSAWRVLRNGAACEDVLQIVLLRLWEHFDEVVAHPNSTALILKITIDAAFDAKRKILKSALHETDLERNATADVVSPLSQVLYNELQSELVTAILDLPEQQRNCIWMHCVEDLDYSSIAVAMGIDEATIRTHVSRGRRVLKSRLRHLYESIEKAE